MISLYEYSWDFVDKDNHPIAVPLQCQVITNNSFMELSLCLAGQGITRIPHFHLTDELKNLHYTLQDQLLDSNGNVIGVIHEMFLNNSSI